MEISAKVYVAARTEELLKKAGSILKGAPLREQYGIDRMEPCAVLPLTGTMYGWTMSVEPANGPEKWVDILDECSEVLKTDGAVVVEFRSPDAPDDYLQYGWTRPRGGAGYGRRADISAYKRVNGNEDISLTIDELFAERTAYDRNIASRRKEKKEAVRREKGDFEITPEGLLRKYRGNDTEVVIPDGVKEIAEAAFVDMKGVERMIMECEDYDAPAMESLVIPESVEVIGGYAFAYCLNLKEVILPDTVKFLGYRAFEGCESLKSIRLSSGLTEIQESTFFLCENLRSVILPEGITSLGDSAFRECSELKKITLPENLKKIGSKAFRGTPLKKVHVPESVTETGENAFPGDCAVN